MATNKITLAISSSAGRKRLQVEKRCTAGSLKTKIRDILSLDEDFKAVRDNGRGRPSTDVIKLIGTTSITTLNLKNGDIIHVSPLSGTRFQETESENLQNGGPSSSASSSIKTSNSETVQASPVAGNLFVDTTVSIFLISFLSLLASQYMVVIFSFRRR